MEKVQLWGFVLQNAILLQVPYKKLLFSDSKEAEKKSLLILYAKVACREKKSLLKSKDFKLPYLRKTFILPQPVGSW